MKPVTKIKINQHGFDHHQYFQGDSAVFTEFDECFVGCGKTEVEALEDAIDQIAEQGEWNYEDVEALVKKENRTIGTKHVCSDDWYWYVSILVKGVESEEDSLNFLLEKTGEAYRKNPAAFVHVASGFLAELAMRILEEEDKKVQSEEE